MEALYFDRIGLRVKAQAVKWVRCGVERDGAFHPGKVAAQTHVATATSGDGRYQSSIA
jgi:hypothetical protein